MLNRLNFLRAFGSELRRHVHVVAMDGAKQRNQQRDQHDDYPRAMDELGDDQYDENDHRGRRAETVNDDRLLPILCLLQFFPFSRA